MFIINHFECLISSNINSQNFSLFLEKKKSSFTFFSSSEHSKGRAEGKTDTQPSLRLFKHIFPFYQSHLSYKKTLNFHPEAQRWNGTAPSPQQRTASFIWIPSREGGPGKAESTNHSLRKPPRSKA